MDMSGEKRKTMRSLIIIEVEHGETTDGLDSLLTACLNEATKPKFGTMLTNYTVRVDLPACFVLDSGA